MKIFLTLLLLSALCFSCDHQEKTSELLYTKLNSDGLIDVYNTINNKIIMENLNAAFSDENDVSYPLSGGDRTMKSSFLDGMGEGMETVVEKDIDGNKIHMKWTLRTFRYKPALAVKLEIKNNTDIPMRINRLTPISAFDGESGIIMDSNGPLKFLEMEPETWADKRMRDLDVNGIGKFVTGIASSDNSGVVIGCLSFDRFRGVFEVNDQRETSGLLQLVAYNDIDDHLVVEASQTLESEWIYIDCLNDVLTGLEQWANLAGKINNAVVSDPPAVGFYTWYYYRDYVSEKIMMDNTKFLAENRDRFPVNYVHIDWGWQRNFSSGDTATNEKFPNGLRWLGTQIREHGYTPSIWCNPFMYTNPTAEAPLKHPDLFLKDVNGNMVEHEPIRNIMANAWGNAEYMLSPGVINVLDISNPGTYDYLNNRYNWVRSMGYDMAMMDFVIYGRNSHSAGHRLMNPAVSTFEGIRKSLFAARDGLGDGGNVLGCGTIYETAVGTSNLTRISYDAIANWSCVKVASSDLILQYFMNERLWTNYADGIFVRDKESPYWAEEFDEEGNRIPMFLTDDEAQFYTAVTGLSQAAVMYTEDIQKLKADRQWLLSLIMPIYQEGKFRPVDLFKTTPAKTLQLECEDGDRKWILAAGLNWTDESDENGLDLGLLDMEKGKKYHAFNIFSQEYMGTVNSETDLGPVNPHGVVLVNLVPDQNRPQVIGTNLHISQGGIEIRDEIWDENAKELTVNLNDLYGRKGDLFVFVPDAYKVSPEADSEVQFLDDGKMLKVPVVLDGNTSISILFE